MSDPQVAQDEIIDAHCHVASPDFFPPSFLEGVVDNMVVALEAAGSRADRRKVRDLYRGRLCDPLCDELAAEMRAAGIARSVLLLADFSFALRDSRLTIAEMIERHREIAQRHPGRFAIFAGVDPRWGSDGIALFEKAVVEYGFSGLKVYPPCGFPASDRLLYPYYERCAELNLPVLIHIGATSPALSFDLAHPMYVDRAALDFPGVNFILAHGSSHYPEECAMLCSHRPNVYLDVSGFEVGHPDQLRSLFRRKISHKVLFGTDWPLFRLQGSQRDFVRRIAGADDLFPEASAERDRAAFFAGNARRLLQRAGRRAAAGHS